MICTGSRRQGEDRGRRWHPDRIRPAYAKFFSEVRGCSGPPLVSNERFERGITSGLHLSCLETRCQETTPILTSTLGGCSSVVLSRPSTSAGSDQTPSHLTGNVVLSFVVCVSDDEVLQANLLASPCLLPGTPHEVILIKNCPSAADGLNLGLERANSRWIVLLHQDVFLPEGWDRRLVQQLQETERRFGPVGVAGVYGVGPARDIPARRSRLIASDAFLTAAGCYAKAQCCQRGSPRSMNCSWSCPRARLCALTRSSDITCMGRISVYRRQYGAYLSSPSMRCAITILEASGPQHVTSSAEAFARKSAHRLPVATPCVMIDRDGSVHLLGNAEEGSTAFTAVAEP